MISDNQLRVLKKVMDDDPREFPVGQGINVVCGKTLSRTRNWWKAIVLVYLDELANRKLQLRLYGWQKKNGEYKQRQKFNLSIAPYISQVISIMQMIAQTSGQDKVVGKLVDRIDELEKVKSFSEVQRSRLSDLKRKVREFRSMINSNNVSEKTVHNFLKNNTWLIGSNYARMFKSEKILTINSKDDFLLKNFNGYSDILELKSPKFNLFVRMRGKRLSFSKELKDAISQVMFYLAEMRTYYLTVKDQTGVDLYFPKGIIIIGRRKNSEKGILQIHKEFLNKIDIWTYDDLIDNASKTIKIYEPG